MSDTTPELTADEQTIADLVKAARAKQRELDVINRKLNDAIRSSGIGSTALGKVMHVTRQAAADRIAKAELGYRPRRGENAAYDAAGKHKRSRRKAAPQLTAEDVIAAVNTEAANSVDTDALTEALPVAFVPAGFFPGPLDPPF